MGMNDFLYGTRHFWHTMDKRACLRNRRTIEVLIDEKKHREFISLEVCVSKLSRTQKNKITFEAQNSVENTGNIIYCTMDGMRFDFYEHLIKKQDKMDKIVIGGHFSPAKEDNSENLYKRGNRFNVRYIYLGTNPGLRERYDARKRLEHALAY